jgi:uncharacterized protein
MSTPFAALVVSLSTLVYAPSAEAASCSAALTFTGTICTPATPGAHAAVVILGGSGGGDRLAPFAMRFAEHGYVAASVAYFGAEGLPRTLDEIPVETVGAAIAAVAQRPDVDPARIGLFGDSKGGELALLAAATYPTIHAVVGVVPSPFAWSGAGTGSSWTLGGKPVPYVQLERRARGGPFRVGAGGGPIEMRVVYDASMQLHRSAISAAMFHLENVRGPILLLAGDDDGVWDSPAQCEFGIAYLRAHAHPYADEYVHYRNAGHAFLFATPQRPLVESTSGAVRGYLGGTPRGNVDARDQAWAKIDDFLARSLEP